MTGTRLEVGLLGPLQVSVAGRPVELPAGRLPALLAVLALSAGQAVPVERLATAVWGEDLSVDARANVQSNVRRLRRLLGAELVATRGGGYALEVEPDRVDALRFVRLLDLAAAAPDPAAQRDRLVEALGLWRGAPFDGVRSDWLEQTQAPWLQERYLAGLERRIDLDLAGYDDAERHLDQALELSEAAGDLAGQAWVHYDRNLVHGLQGRDADALAAAQRALELFQAAGDPDAARDAWRQARAILDELDRPAADQLRTRLHRFDQPAAAEALFRA